MNRSCPQKVFIRASNLTKVFKPGSSRIEVLKDLDLEVNHQQTLAVVGASGVGKSTLLHIIGGLEEPTGGDVCYDDQNIYQQNQKTLSDIRNRLIGFIFQFHHLLPEFNAIENAGMPAMIQGATRKQACERAEEILVRVGLKDRLGHRIGELSGGEQQRVAVARALVNRPKLLLADEPTGNLDQQTGNRINELLMELNEEQGLTTVIVTHNLELAKMMSSQIRLVDGKAYRER